jgi:hypothetical protein
MWHKVVKWIGVGKLCIYYTAQEWSEENRFKEKNEVRTIRTKCCYEENDKYREDGDTKTDK